MVGSVNKVILLGRLGKDPDIRSMQNGKKLLILVLQLLNVGLIEILKKKKKRPHGTML